MPRPVCFLSRLRPGPAFSLLRLATTRKLGRRGRVQFQYHSLGLGPLVSLCPPAVVSSSREIVKAALSHQGCVRLALTSVSLPPFVSRRGLSNTNQRLSL